jgi:hypothetical protein
MKPSERIKEIKLEAFTDGIYDTILTKLEKIIYYLDETWEENQNALKEFKEDLKDYENIKKNMA